MISSRHSWHIACYEKFEKKGDDICLGCKDKIEPFDTDVVETSRGYRWHKGCHEHHVAIGPGCGELLGYKFCRSNSGRLWCTTCWQNSGEGDDYRFKEGTKATRYKNFGKSYTRRAAWRASTSYHVSEIQNNLRELKMNVLDSFFHKLRSKNLRRCSELRRRLRSRGWVVQHQHT